MHKALSLRDDIHRLYVSRKKGGRRRGSIEYTVDTRRLHKTRANKTNYSDQKLYKHHKDHLNINS